MLSSSSNLYVGDKGDLNLHELWKEVTLKQPSWKHLNINAELAHIQTKIENDVRLPTNNCIFRIFRLVPPENITVMLLGQDPYPELIDVKTVGGETIRVPRACGFAFSSPLGRIPYSLNIIFKEILGESPNKKSGDLSYLLSQGVFLLNSFLTVKVDEVTQKGKPNSHTSWHAFTAKVIKYVRDMNPKAIWLAIGDDAKYKMESSSIKDYIYAGHPAAMRFGYKSNSFLGSGIFNKANEMLVQRELCPVSWEPMNEEDTCDTEYFIQ